MTKALPPTRLWLAFILGYCVLMNMLSRGIGETFAVFLLPLAEEFSWSRATLTGAYSTYMIGYGLCAPVAGVLFSRLGARFTYTSGLTCLGLGYVGASFAQSAVQLYLCIGLLSALGAACVGMVPAAALVRRWFPTRLTTALGVAYAGLGGGVLLMAPLSQTLIEQFGWRSSYLLVAAMPLVLVPIVALLPWSRMAGVTSRPASAEPLTEPDWTLTRAARTLPFWGLFVSFFGTSCGIFMLLPQIVAYFISTGFTPLRAATAFGAIGMLSIIGMVGVAWASERYGRIRVVSLSYASSAIGCLLFWGLTVEASGALLVVGLIIFGVPNGCRAPIISALAARLFTGRGYAAVMGGLNAGMGLGAGIGSLIGATIHDLSGGYDWIFPCAVLSLLVANSMLWLIGPLRRGAW